MRNVLYVCTLALSMSVILAGCVCHNKDIITFDPKFACPLPSSLPKEDRDKAIDFTAKVEGIAKAVSGFDLETKLADKTKTEYPNADKVNLIYALTYAACVSCRVNAADLKACGAAFEHVIAKFTGPTSEAGLTPTQKNALDYQKGIFKSLL